MSRRVVTLIATALGLALLVWQVKVIGVANILDDIRRLGWTGLALIMAASAIRQGARAMAWMLVMGPESAVPFRSALAAIVAGEALGNLTPLSLIVSEPAKAMYLSDHVPPQRALAALAAENFFYSLSVAIAVLFGVAVLFWRFAVPSDLRAASVIIVVGMAAVLLGALWLVAKQPALLSATIGRLTGPRILGKIRDLEVTSYGFVRSHPGRLIGVVACETVFHAFSIAETWVTLLFLGVPSIALAIVLDTVQRVINVVFKVVPLRSGVDEVGSGITSSALGYGVALGVTMGVIRKIRVLFWAGVGVILLSQRAKGKGQN